MNLETLTHTDLNAEFDNILNNGESVSFPATSSKDFDGNEIILDVDADSSLTADTDDRADLRLNGVDLFRWDGTVASPVVGLDFIAGATGNAVRVTTTGSDTNRSINFQSAGIGTVQANGEGLFAPIRNNIGGLITSNNSTDAANDIDIAVGECRDSTDVVQMILGTAITKRIDAAWAVGTNQGGMDTGSVANNTTYAIWLIERSDTGVVDALFSTSFTSPTMPTSYDRRRLIGSLRTEGTPAIIAYTQVGDYFRYTGDVIRDIADGTIASNVFETGTLSVPPSSHAHIYGLLENTSSSNNTDARLHIRTAGAADGADNRNQEAWIVAGTSGSFDFNGAQGMVLVNSSSQINYAAPEVTGAASIEISTLGFWMLTRREP